MGKGKETACKAAAILGITVATFGCVLPDEQEKNEVLNNNDNNPQTVITAPAPSLKENLSNMSDGIEKYLDLKEQEEELREESSINNSQKVCQAASPPDNTHDNTNITEEDNTNITEEDNTNITEEDNANITEEDNTNITEEDNANITEEVTIVDDNLNDFGTVDNPDETVTDEDSLEDFGTLDDEIAEETTEEETEIDIDSEEDYEIDDE